MIDEVEEESKDQVEKNVVGDNQVQKLGSSKYQLKVFGDDRDIEKIKEYCEKQNLPLIEEYEFKKEHTTPDLDIEIKSTTMVRDY